MDNHRIQSEMKAIGTGRKKQTMQIVFTRIRKIIRNRRMRRFLNGIVSIAVAFVVLVTTYALIFPAITMEAEAQCGIEAHQHDDSCYEDVLVCGLEESEGHTHDESCYSVSYELACDVPEHQHDETCYDENGNLLCERTEHVHADNCYTENRELTCEIPEAEGHIHEASCYERQLVCGKEAHTHSAACYEDDAGAVPVNPADGQNSAATLPPPASSPVDPADEEKENSASEGAYAAAGAGTIEGTDATAGTGTTEDPNTPEIPEDTMIQTSAGDGTTTQAAVSADGADLYVPELEPLFFNALLTEKTSVYYYSVAEDETITNSAGLTDWKKIKKDTELGERDLLRIYLAYTIPAGSLNATNDTARYRLPYNLHLSDAQIEAINQTENGIAVQYADGSDTASGTDTASGPDNGIDISTGIGTGSVDDTDNYHKYLGAEAVEGSRCPSDDPAEYLRKHGGEEYISAVVRVENVYDDTTGDYLGQDLIFTFVPYTVQKNQNEYRADGTPTKAGEKVQGWFTLDFNTEQIDWTVTEENFSEASYQLDNDAAAPDPSDNDSAASDLSDNDSAASDASSEKTAAPDLSVVKEAKIVFVEKTKADPSNNIGRLDEISTNLRLVEYVKGVEGAEDADGMEGAEGVEDAEGMEAVEGAEDADGMEGAETSEGVEGVDSNNTKENETEDGQDVPDHPVPAASFEDTGTDAQTGKMTITAEEGAYRITVTYGDEAGVPEGSKLDAFEITSAADEADGAKTASRSDDGFSDSRDDTSSADSALLSYEEYAALAEQALGLEEGSASSVRLFDIRIVDENGEKVEIQAPVDVKIELAGERFGDNTTNIVHFADNADPEVIEAETNTNTNTNTDAVSIENPETDGGSFDDEMSRTVCFEAEGFSVYAVVDGPEPVEPANPEDYSTASSLEELAQNCGNDSFKMSVIVSSTLYYIQNSINDKDAFVEANQNQIVTSADWTFEPVSGQNRYRISTKVGNATMYMKQKGTSMTFFN